MSESEPRVLNVDFNFNTVKYKRGLEQKLSKKAMVFEDYFIHFERVFKIGDDSLLIKCAFGSFDRPENKYILMDSTGCRYFAAAPVKTGVNSKAHQKMIDIFLEGDERV